MSNSTPVPAAWRLGLVGRKVGMTRIFTEDGESVPVTVLDVSNNRVTQVKSPEADGYAAVQVAYGTRRATRVNKAATGHYAKAGVEAGSVLKEFRLDPAKAAEHTAGAVIAVDSVFEVGQKVDVTGTTIGKGFCWYDQAPPFSGQRRSTVTRFHTEFLVLSVWLKIPVVYSVRKWPVIWVLLPAQFKT